MNSMPARSSGPIAGGSGIAEAQQDGYIKLACIAVVHGVPLLGSQV
jgi:hypothetical protein